MLFLFGRSVPSSLSAYFAARAKQDGHEIIFASMGVFPSSECFTELKSIPPERLRGQPAVVIDSFARVGEFSANDFFTTMLMAGDTLERYGAGHKWAVTPFGPYARQDQAREGKMDSVGCEVAAKHLAIDFVGHSSIELHSLKARKILEKHFGQKNVFVVDPTELFVQDLAQLKLTNPVVASPDKGANARADALAAAIGADRFYIDKERREIVNVRITGSRGEVEGRDVLVVDDMGDRMTTGDNALRFVREKGALSARFYAAHPILSNPAWEKLAKLAEDGIMESAVFGNTIARDAELAAFAQQYGAAAAGKVRFLNTAEILYRHIMNDVVTHPAMQPERM